MREIKFRGQDVETNEWYFGGICQIGEEFYIVDGTGRYNLRAVIAETVGQYTGKMDKNFKFIYEGDIVRITTKYYTDCSKKELRETETRIEQVVFENYTFGFKKDGSLQPFLWALSFDYDIQVIGNIYDNPELLKLV